MSDNLIDQVQSKYASVAKSALSSDHAGVRAVAEAFGYSPEELASLPADANMGLSCGNPTAVANLRPGETVVDLGCGGGLDVLLAAPKVGPTGKAIGIDMTPEMLQRARANAAKLNLTNVEFDHATIDQLPLPNESVDCVISNCVINLAPDKPAVFREIYRVLKPGGRLAVSDIALKKPLPPEVASDVMAYIGCIAGAVLVRDYERDLRAAGFASVQIVDTHKDLNAYAKVENQSACCSPTMIALNEQPSGGSCCGDSTAVHAGLADLLARYDVNDYAASVQVFALKPNM
jgi:arsenite methyltransferase